MNRRLALVIFAFAFMVVVYVGILHPERFNEQSDQQRPAPWLLSRPRPAPASSGKADERKPASAELRTSWESEPLRDEALQEKYGRFRWEKLPTGRAVALVAEPGEARGPSQKTAGFQPMNPSHAIARAWQVLGDARTSLGIQAAFPPGQPAHSGTDLSAQVVYRQLVDGVPIANGGDISIVMDRDGAVRAVYSDYYPQVVVENRRTLPTPAGGRPIAWVTENVEIAGQESRTSVRLAYEMRERGMQTVFDAETGSKLVERDKRVH